MEYKIVLSALLGLIIVVSLLANILVCLVILSTRPLRQSNDACFVLSVAVSDLLTTCLVIPFDLDLIVSDSTEWRHGEIMCNVFTTAYLLTVPTSILSLLALSVYRYIKLKNPLDHLKLSPLITKRRVMAITILLWIYSTGTRKRKPHSKNRDIPSHHLWGKTPSIVTKHKIEDLRQPYHSKKIHWETIWPPKPPSWLCLRSLSVGSHIRY